MCLFVCLSLVLRNFRLGDDAQLPCSNKTWNETLFIVWKIDMKHKQCSIGFSSDGQSKDSCNDGKSLKNTSSAQSHLHIPNFSNDDVGIYTCDFIFNGGVEKHEFNLSITGRNKWRKIWIRFVRGQVFVIIHIMISTLCMYSIYSIKPVPLSGKLTKLTFIYSLY